MVGRALLIFFKSLLMECRILWIFCRSSLMVFFLLDSASEEVHVNLCGALLMNRNALLIFCRALLMVRRVLL